MERSVGLGKVVRDLEAARVSAERLQLNIRVVEVSKLREISAGLERLTQELKALRSSRVN